VFHLAARLGQPVLGGGKWEAKESSPESPKRTESCIKFQQYFRSDNHPHPDSDRADPGEGREKMERGGGGKTTNFYGAHINI